MLEVEKVSIRLFLIFMSPVLGLVEYGNDHLMLERTKFNKLELDCKEKVYMTLNAIASCLLNICPA